MRCLLLIAHGSRREESNREITALARKLDEHSGNPYAATRRAFLEMARPSIPDAVEQCIREGAGEIAALPYFLSPGNHVTQDIPDLLDNKRREHPNIRITLLDHFGRSQGVIDWLIQHIAQG